MPLRTKKKDPNKDNASLHAWCRSLKEEGRARRQPQEAQWWENLATYAGDFWAEYDVTSNRLVETRRDNHKVRLPINLAQPVVRTEYAKLVKNRPIIDVVAKSNDKRDLDAAEVGDKLLNNYCEHQFNLPKVRRRALHWVLTCGLGGVFVDYDETLLGETEVLVDPEGNAIFDPAVIKSIQRHYKDVSHRKPKMMVIPHGDVRVVAISPFQLIWDFSENYLEDARWLIVSDIYDVDEVWRRWEVEVKPSSKSVPGVMERRQLARFDLSGMMDWKPGSTQELVEVHRMFIRPGHRYFEGGAEIVFTDNELIETTQFPYSHGELPVSTMGHVPMPVSQHPMSVLQAVKPVVLELSKTESQMIENRNLMANPPWIEFEQNRIQGEIQNKPGMRLKVNYMPNVPEPHPIEMPDLPMYVKDLPEILKQHVLEISGQGETSQGRVPAGARSGVAIAYLQEEDDTKLGPTVQEYEEMIERMAGHLLWTIAQRYDTPRTIHIYKRHSQVEVFNFVGTMLTGVEGVKVQAGSALPRSKAAKQQFVLDLFDRQIETDPRKVKEMLELGGGDPDEWELSMEQAEREHLKMMKGEPAPVLEWYNHPAHHYVHRRFMISGDFEQLDPAIQKIFTKHDQEHSDMEATQKQQQMVEQALMGAQPDGSAAQGVPPGPAQGGANGVNATPQPPFVGETPPNGAAPMNVQDMQPQ
jgi:hypothetical protein